MKKEDFKTMTEEHVKICEKIIKNGGACKTIICDKCPFTYYNSTHEWGCMRYVVEECDSSEKSKHLVKNAKLFIELYKG